MQHYILDRQPLNFEIIEDIITNKRQVKIDEETKAVIQRCRQYLDEKMRSRSEPLYGINTGFGSLHNRMISNADLEKLQHNLVVSHACGTGNVVPREVVKIMLLLKAHSLSFGYSGVQTDTVQRLIDFFNHDILPEVYEQGSLGASGDLAPLAHLSLTLLGRGHVYYQNKRYPAEEILKKLKWKPVQLQSKEGLALLNGTQFMSGYGVYTLFKAFKLSKFADITGALSLEAYNGRIDPFSEEIQQIRNHRGQVETAGNFRGMLEGSQIMAQEKPHLQDPYSFRCIPQVHGASKDAINHTANVVLNEINAVTDNPIIFPEQDRIISGGNFHGQPLALVFDFLSMALAELGNIAERRIYRLISGQRDLPEFLVANPGLNSGFMIPQYTAASLVSMNKQLCSPASVDSIPSSNEQEDHVSMGANAAVKALKVADNLERILAIELYTAAQALDFRKPLKTSPYLEDLLSAYRETVSFIEHDRIMYEDIDATIRFIQNGEFFGE